MKRYSFVLLALLAVVAAWTVSQRRTETRVSAQQAQNLNVPKIAFESVPDYFKYPATMNQARFWAWPSTPKVTW
jgi:hypothetical protein